jgi:hypothetical protein
MVSLLTQLEARKVEMVLEFVEAPVALVVRVKEAVPFGLLMFTTEFAGKALNRAAANPAVVEVELYGTEMGPTDTPPATTVNEIVPESGLLVVNVRQFKGSRLGGPPVQTVLVLTFVELAPPTVTVRLAEVAACVSTFVLRSAPEIVKVAVPAVAPLTPAELGTLSSEPDTLRDAAAAVAPSNPGWSTRTI